MHHDNQQRPHKTNGNGHDSNPLHSQAERSRVLGILNELHQRYRQCGEGFVADYIPELAKANPDWFGISVVTTTGHVYDVGDADQPFTIQSMSKPFVYGLALEDVGRDAMLQRVGVEPTGDPFNSIIKLDANNRPHNPMVNAGAIATTGLVKGNDATDRLNRLLGTLGRYIGRRPGIDMSVYMSERTTGHRNRAMAHLMLNFGVINSNVEEILDLYFQQCSVLVTARDVATMAATLANHGINPLTGQSAIHRQYIRDVLTVMLTCGMYNYAGEWAYTVGLPAKSGVAGGVFAVVPGQFGLCVFSPPVDERGTSVRGIRVCEELSRDWGVHVFDFWQESGSLFDHSAGMADPHVQPHPTRSKESGRVESPSRVGRRGSGGSRSSE